MLSAAGKPITLIISPSEIGAGKRGAATGPFAVKDLAGQKGIHFDHVKLLDYSNVVLSDVPTTYAKHISALIENMRMLNDRVSETIAANELPLILSGDHSNAIGGLSGLKNALENKRVGVIWIDAHADLHSPYTTPSGNIHGMPLAALSGLDHKEMKHNEVGELAAYYWNELKTLGVHKLTPKFDIKDLVLIGVRDAEDEEWAVIEQQGIKTFEPDDINNKGIEAVLDEAIEALKDCDVLYVSFDADSLDTSVSVGTGTPVDNGLQLEEGKAVFRRLLNHPKTAVFEITEVNPQLDEDGREMAAAIAALLEAGLAK